MAPACRFQLAKLFLLGALSRAPFVVSGRHIRAQRFPTSPLLFSRNDSMRLSAPSRSLPVAPCFSAPFATAGRAHSRQEQATPASQPQREVARKARFRKLLWRANPRWSQHPSAVCVLRSLRPAPFSLAARPSTCSEIQKLPNWLCQILRQRLFNATCWHPAASACLCEITHP